LLLNHIELRHGPNRQRPPVPTARPAKVDMLTGLVLQRVGTQYPCPVPGCPRAFNKAIELKYHFDGVHKQQRAFPCDWAGCFKVRQPAHGKQLASLTQMPRLETHLVWPLLLLCAVQSFVSPAQLNLHKCKHTGAPRPHMCKFEGCNKTFNTPSQVAKHAQMHLEKSERTWLPCPLPGCTQTYATQSAIKKHIATAHDPSQLRFRCSDPTLMGVFLMPGPAKDTACQCTSAFFTKATWVEHLRAKHNIDPQQTSSWRSCAS